MVLFRLQACCLLAQHGFGYLRRLAEFSQSSEDFFVRLATNEIDIDLLLSPDAAGLPGAPCYGRPLPCPDTLTCSFRAAASARIAFKVSLESSADWQSSSCTVHQSAVSLRSAVKLRWNGQ